MLNMKINNKMIDYKVKIGLIPDILKEFCKFIPELEFDLLRNDS